MTTNRASRIWTCGLYWISSNHGVETNLIGKFYAIRTNCVFRNIGTIVKAYPASNHKNLEFPTLKHVPALGMCFLPLGGDLTGPTRQAGLGQEKCGSVAMPASRLHNDQLGPACAAGDCCQHRNT